MKKILVFLIIGLANVALNFAVFIVSYNKLATPYLYEEQRVTNANFIMGYTLPGYLLIGLLTMVLVYFYKNKQVTNK